MQLNRVGANHGIWSLTPACLIVLRIALGPLLVWAVFRGAPEALVGGILGVAMLSDIFDGVIARRLKIATARLRVADSWADAWFFGCVGASCWLAKGEVVRHYALPICLELLLQGVSYTYDLVRYGRITSIHAYTAKAWGFSLYLATFSLLLFGVGSPIWLCFCFGLAAFIDGAAIKLILPGWRHDVPSMFHALRLRQAELAAAGS